MLDNISTFKLDFELKLNYPNKKGLLTQNGKMNVRKGNYTNYHRFLTSEATDKYRGTQEINVRQPAIVLLNPEDAGSLIATEHTSIEQQQNAAYWKKRVFIYIMGNIIMKKKKFNLHCCFLVFSIISRS